MNPMQEKIRKYMTDKPEYRRENLRYLNYDMKMKDQETLIGYLKEMNLKELQYAQGAGIPGHANTIALQLMSERRKDMEEYLNTKGSEPIPEIEAERRLMLTTAPSLKTDKEAKPKKKAEDLPQVEISTEDKEAWHDGIIPIEEVEKDGKHTIHTSKKGREDDSEAL